TNYGNYMRIEFIKEIEENLITLKELHNHGMKGNVQGPRSLSNELLDFVLEVLEKTSDFDESQIENVEYKEGKILKKYGSKFERNSKLREKAIEIHGVTCKVCGFNFEKKYGNIGKNFIEIHHIKPMYDIRKEILVNPQTDLIPLCSNCHKMIHRSKRKPYTIAQLKSAIKIE
ncbi:HNH endonuclease, partial [Staphylococcus haemolyticus]|uniref:HNH endonuclease n=1 Tax=Staphylococcus haemolyticus TaxID=1283 RepID=UPI002175315F